MLLRLTLAWLATSGAIVWCAMDFGQLLAKEDYLVSTLDSYLQAQDRKSNEIRNLLSELQRQHSDSQENEHLANPIATYNLVKRLSSFWQRIFNAAQDPADALLSDILERRDVESRATLDAVAATLIRLQDTYKLDVESLASGELNGVQYTDELDANDCFDFGRRAYLSDDFQRTAAWMTEALARHDENTAENVTEILGYIAHSSFKLGNLPLATQITREILEVDPEDHKANLNLPWFLERAADPQQQAQPIAQPSARPDGTDEVYRALCRGELQIDEATRSQLRCRFADKGSWFLHLARLKEEEAYLSPRILIYHDVISSKEIQQIVEKSRPKLQDALVMKHSGPIRTIADDARTARNCWFAERELHAADVLNRRAGDLAGVTSTSAEHLQIAQYGVGGHYAPHYDHVEDSQVERFFGEAQKGNRIATVMYYLNDVPHGGATVFPKLKVSVWPAKGAAIVWFNLHRDGAGDARTQHAGCPVLVGTKWVANQWLHQCGQELTHPCDLEQDSKNPSFSGENLVNRWF